MDLAKRCGGRGGEVEAGEPGRPIWSKLRRKPPFHKRRPHSRGVGLQLGEFRGELRRQQVGHGGENLRHLHQRTLELAEGLLQRASVARLGVATAENGVRAEGGRRAAEARAHSGEAGNTTR